MVYAMRAKKTYNGLVITIVIVAIALSTGANVTVEKKEAYMINGYIPTHTKKPQSLRRKLRRWNGEKKKMYKFKNGDRILVANEDEYKRLLGLLHEQGYEWGDGSSLLDETECDWDSITNVKFDKVIISIHKTKSRKRVTWNNTNILPYSAISTNDESEITAVEAIRMQGAMCTFVNCHECPSAAAELRAKAQESNK